MFNNTQLTRKQTKRKRNKNKKKNKNKAPVEDPLAATSLNIHKKINNFNDTAGANKLTSQLILLKKKKEAAFLK